MIGLTLWQGCVVLIGFVFFLAFAIGFITAFVTLGIVPALVIGIWDQQGSPWAYWSVLIWLACGGASIPWVIYLKTSGIMAYLDGAPTITKRRLWSA